MELSVDPALSVTAIALQPDEKDLANDTECEVEAELYPQFINKELLNL